MSGIDQYQEKISGRSVAGLVIEFQRRLRDVYPVDVMASALCAVGPLQTMIGLGIDMGILTTPAAPEPKCTSWLGHRFMARYSTTAVQPLTFNEAFYLTGSQRDDLIESRGNRAYEGDVCTRCGCVVNRKPS